MSLGATRRASWGRRRPTLDAPARAWVWETVAHAVPWGGRGCRRAGRGLGAGGWAPSGNGAWGTPAPQLPSCLAARPPPPRLGVERESGKSAAVLLPSSPQVSLRCVAPVEGVEFQLRRGDQELLVNSWGTTPGTVNFELKSLKPADSGLYTCRYQLRREGLPWSLDSAPVELLLSDGELGAAPRGGDGRSGEGGERPGERGAGGGPGEGGARPGEVPGLFLNELSNLEASGEKSH